jgi:hypothetical protein
MRDSSNGRLGVRVGIRQWTRKHRQPALKIAAFAPTNSKAPASQRSSKCRANIEEERTGCRMKGRAWPISLEEFRGMAVIRRD